MEHLGNRELLKQPKTAFLASGTIAPDVVLRTPLCAHCSPCALPPLCHSVPGTLWRVYQLYGFTEEELDFIRSALPLASSKNYDIKYRMGDELSAEE